MYTFMNIQQFRITSDPGLKSIIWIKSFFKLIIMVNRLLKMAVIFLIVCNLYFGFSCLSRLADSTLEDIFCVQ